MPSFVFFKVMRQQLARVEPDHIDHIEKELEDTTNVKVSQQIRVSKTNVY